MKPEHIPVMAREALDYLITGSGRVYIDCTVGMGGHAARILEATSPFATDSITLIISDFKPSFIPNIFKPPLD